MSNFGVTEFDFTDEKVYYAIFCDAKETEEWDRQELQHFRERDRGQKEEEQKLKLLDRPWRNVGSDKWNAQFQKTLLVEITQISRPKTKMIKQCRILEIGPIGAGKTSLFNTIASPFEGRVSFRGNTGGVLSARSTTNKLREYNIRSTYDGQPFPFRICDTCGLEENGGISLIDFEYLINGNVPNGYEFNPNAPINDRIPNYRRNPTIEDKIHCVCFVFAADTVNVITPSTLAKIQSFVARLNQLDIPPVVVLTKMDEICPHVKQDVSKMYYSTQVQKTVDRTSEILGVPRNRIIPVVNYESENIMSVDINISVLLALRTMVQSCEDFFKN